KIGHLSLMVMLDATSKAPAIKESRSTIDGSARAGNEPRVSVKVMRDPFEYRGTGGVLHDVARELEDDDYLVVATGAQLLLEPLKELVAGLTRRGGDVGILAHRDGMPSGLMLVRCGVLRQISDLGFVDLKEQALPAIAKKHRVTVETWETASYAIRTAGDY